MQALRYAFIATGAPDRAHTLMHPWASRLSSRRPSELLRAFLCPRSDRARYRVQTIFEHLPGVRHFARRFGVFHPSAAAFSSAAVLVIGAYVHACPSLGLNGWPQGRAVACWFVVASGVLASRVGGAPGCVAVFNTISVGVLGHCFGDPGNHHQRAATWSFGFGRMRHAECQCFPSGALAGINRATILIRGGRATCLVWSLFSLLAATSWLGFWSTSRGSGVNQSRVASNDITWGPRVLCAEPGVRDA